jgi:hypothetical protein
MSDSNDLTKIRSIRISDTHDFMDIASEAGTYSKKLENGVVCTITIDKGKIVKLVAKDSEGNSLRTFNLKMHSVGPADQGIRPADRGEGTICFCCLGSGSYTETPLCYKVSCDLT